MSNFDKYIRKAGCYMSDCPYGYDISCEDCVRRMVEEHYAEHNKQVRTEIIDECVDILNDSFPLVDNMDVIVGFNCACERLKQLKEQKE